MSLSDHIDLLNRNTRNIKAIAQDSSKNAPFVALFTHAILQSHLGDLIRDVDPSELGLFSLVQPEGAPAHENPFEIERINFHGATPLKRPNPRRDDASRLREDPDLYAEAALKYMDRYKLVRPMPRAQVQVQAILERIPVLRRSIEDLTDGLYQLEQAHTSIDPDYKSRLEEEERSIRELRAKLTQLTNKRLALTKAKKSHLDLTEDKGAASGSVPPSTINPEELEFWNTPAASTRTFRFSGDNLLTEQGVDFADISTISFSASPAPSKAAPNIFTDNAYSLSIENPRRHLFQTSDLSPDRGALPKPPQAQLLESPCAPTQDTLESNLPNSDANISPIYSESHQLDPRVVGTTSTENGSSITITPDVEVIATKIWAVMSELIVAAAGTGVELSDKPSTRKIINYLEKVQETTPSDSLSMSANDGPTLQQVLTAALLVGLLASPTHHSLSLGKVKELLTARTDGMANATQPNSSRIVYGCVAKRLLRIDRTGGEQIVTFDV